MISPETHHFTVLNYSDHVLITTGLDPSEQEPDPPIVICGSPVSHLNSMQEIKSGSGEHCCTEFLFFLKRKKAIEIKMMIPIAQIALENNFFN